MPRLDTPAVLRNRKFLEKESTDRMATMPFRIAEGVARRLRKAGARASR